MASLTKQARAELMRRLAVEPRYREPEDRRIKRLIRMREYNRKQKILEEIERNAA